MSSNDGKSPTAIFDRARVRQRRTRNAANFHQADFLHRRVMDDIVDRLETIKRDFPQALLIGGRGMARHLTPACGIGTLFEMDVSALCLSQAERPIVADDEYLPIADHSLDLIVSILTLHTSNDVIGALIQARKALKPDGVFIAAVYGEGTLIALRHAMNVAETSVTGSLARRFAPFAAIQDFGQALGRAGFALPVTDTDEVTITYGEPAKLLSDLKAMGETGILAGQVEFLPRQVLITALEQFQAAGARENFTIVYLTGWAPDQSQPKPAPRGSGTISLADAVKQFSNED